MSKSIFLITFFSLICLIITLQSQNNNDYCQKIQCYPNLPSDICIKVDSSISLLNPCPSSHFCNIIIEDPIDNTFCKEKDKSYLPFKKLPSLPCNDSIECMSNKCVAFKCVASQDGDTCENSYDCNYGKTCRKNNKESNIKKCLDPLKEGEKCEIDTDCEINLGCRNGICTKYFSLDNFEKTGGNDYGKDFTFCKSGYVNEVGICMNISLKNDITECSNESPCQYEFLDENNKKQNITIHQNCLCGYNPFGKKYCLIGSGNYNYTRYIEKLKKYHMNNINCHLSERTSEGCQKDILFGSNEILNQIQELKNAKYWAKSNNRLIEAPECVYSIELPDYNRTLDINQIPEPIPEGKCAKYSCKEKIKGGTCALSEYKSPFEINVTLSNVCSEGIKCNLDGNPNDVFYNGTNKEYICGGHSKNKRYPGEKCNIDSECVYPLNNPSSQFHKCEEGICNGIDEDGICEDNSWCLVGYYCDKKEGKCKSQLKEGKRCSESKECKNDLICINNKCEELFKLNDGDTVPEYESDEFKKFFCKNFEVIENKCVSFSDINNKVNDNEYKKCDFNSYCEYSINGLNPGRKKYVKCACGYNNEGQGYCPHFHDYSKDDWEEYRNLWKKRSDNDCHTESRFNCYEYDEEKSYEWKQYKNRLENGHLFYNSVECANKVLGSSYLVINKFMMVLFAGLFIFLL